MKQKKAALAIPTNTIRGDEDEEATNPLNSLSEVEPYGRVRRECRQPAISNDLELKFQSLKGSLDLDEFLKCMHIV